jgi:regulator of protease activity HflC (stomatin/prohibitin superfamily)
MKFFAGFRLGESAIPPELLLARQREQLAEQLKRAFVQEQAAQEQRQKTEQARAAAEQQNTLVTAQINLQKSQLFVNQRDNDGAAEQKYLERVAAGQKSQTEVLRQERVAMLKALEMILEKPQVLQALASVKLPGTMVVGSSSGFNLDSVAAILKGSFDANKEAPHQ